MAAYSINYSILKDICSSYNIRYDVVLDSNNHSTTLFFTKNGITCKFTEREIIHNSIKNDDGMYYFIKAKVLPLLVFGLI
jgi:hypothetical protein